MRAVPRSLREASYGLGARRLTTSLRVVFPAAISGIVAALILATSRAIGETMVVAIAAGASGSGARSFDIFNVGQTITAAMASLAIGTDQVRGGDSRTRACSSSACAVRDDPRAQPHRRRVRPPDAAAVLMLR